MWRLGRHEGNGSLRPFSKRPRGVTTPVGVGAARQCSRQAAFAFWLSGPETMGVLLDLTTAGPLLVTVPSFRRILVRRTVNPMRYRIRPTVTPMGVLAAGMLCCLAAVHAQ